MSDLVIDTHAALWYFAKSPSMSAIARTAVNSAIEKKQCNNFADRLDCRNRLFDRKIPTNSSNIDKLGAIPEIAEQHFCFARFN